jgi:hypothetical protein
MYDENLLLHLMGEQTPRADVGEQSPHGVRPLAMVYSPKHEWGELYDNDAGLARGTVFKELEFPFFGGDAYD